ncbi:Zim17-type zinc finger-containing protein [Cavenderia fasciculata]|uniref:Zim17-type zinc finger-containing protein n=1 Tax=Cavenderia fasciculata TaxID=261658 RepID=F4QAT9_CACFS|nr:Zim17-type zinc finger-containing protein [Cavenderia fasciculata]EGG14998.1 Zim17-type zinc finger-containing protein [Cavenderia fasciculata]|eukprot:XP_004351718.1 Zim17-type zinc finger-containing protein [Cavenderia fasciculata]
MITNTLTSRLSLLSTTIAKNSSRLQYVIKQQPKQQYYSSSSSSSYITSSSLLFNKWNTNKVTSTFNNTSSPPTLSSSISNSYFYRYFTNSKVLLQQNNNKSEDEGSNQPTTNIETNVVGRGMDKEVAFYAEEDPNIQSVYNDQGIKVEPRYYIEFTCTYKGPEMKEECGYRSKKTFSKHAYHKGVVIIKCEGCEKLHLIADHLGWSGYDGGKTIEEWMEQKGVPIQRYMIEQDKSSDDVDEQPKSLGGTNDNNNNNNNSGNSKQ